MKCKCSTATPTKEDELKSFFNTMSELVHEEVDKIVSSFGRKEECSTCRFMTKYGQILFDKFIFHITEEHLDEILTKYWSIKDLAITNDHSEVIGGEVHYRRDGYANFSWYVYLLSEDGESNMSTTL